MEKQYILSEGLRKGLLDYLVSRPYGEVAQGVQALMSLAELPPAKPEPVEDQASEI